MIKTDGVIYRIKTLKEYNWLMQELDEAGCVWIDGEFPTEANLFHINMPNIYIFMNNKELTYREEEEGNDILSHYSMECIDVSELIENGEQEND